MVDNVKRIISVTCCLFIPALCAAQSKKNVTNFVENSDRCYLSLQWIGLALHPKGGSIPEIYPLKLDKHAYSVLEIGGVFSIDYRIAQKSFIRISVAYYRDCAFVPAGCIHIGYRHSLLNKTKHSFLIGIGPALLFREDWHQFSEYKGDRFYGDRISGKWQYHFLIFAGEIEYLYEVQEKIVLHYSLIPGYPYVFTSRIGLRIKL